jgi:hypothetical protein
MRPRAEGVIFRGYTYQDENGHNKKGTFLSNYTPPGNPQTIPQQTWRATMTAAVLNWHNLGQQAKQSWNNRAKKMHMSGFNLHNREYLRDHH